MNWLLRQLAKIRLLLPYTKLRDAVLTHPTLMEGLISLFASAPSVVARTANASA